MIVEVENKTRFIDEGREFVEGQCPVIHSFEIHDLFLTFFFTGPDEKTFKMIADIDRQCKYRLDRHEPTVCHPEDVKVSWVKKHFPESRPSWVHHKHIWFNKKESKKDAINYTLGLLENYMSQDLINSIRSY